MYLHTSNRVTYIYYIFIYSLKIIIIRIHIFFILQRTGMPIVKKQVTWLLLKKLNISNKLCGNHVIFPIRLLVTFSHLLPKFEASALTEARGNRISSLVHQHLTEVRTYRPFMSNIGLLLQTCSTMSYSPTVPKN